MSECDTSRLLTPEFITIDGRMVLFVNFLNIPRDLLTNLATGWLNWIDVARWDSAICSKEHREEWLNILQNDCVSEYVCISIRWAKSSLHCWFVVRQIRTGQLYVEHDDASKEPATTLWLENTKFLLKRVTFRLRKSNQMLLCVAERCDQLRVLHFDSCHIDKHMWEVIGGRLKLEELRIFGRFLDAKMEVPTNASFPCLERLDIDCNSFRPGYATSLVHNPPALRTLRLRSSYSTDLYATVTAACSNLVNLDLEHVEYRSRTGSWEYDNVRFTELMAILKPGLRCLVLPDHTYFSTREWESIALYHARSLHCLRIPNMIRHDSSFSEFLNNLPYLLTLDLTSTCLLHKSNLVLNPTITHLYLELTKESEWNVLYTLRGQFPGLTSLSLSNCKNFYGTMIVEEELIFHPRLRTVYLDDNRMKGKLRQVFPNIEFKNYSMVDIFRVSY